MLQRRWVLLLGSAAVALGGCATLLDIEPRLRRIKGYRSLPLLRQALQAELRGEAVKTGSQAA